MSTSNSHTDEMAILQRCERLRAAIDRGMATPEDHQEYDALMDALETRLTEPATGPRERPASGQRDVAA